MLEESTPGLHETDATKDVAEAEAILLCTETEATKDEAEPEPMLLITETDATKDEAEPEPILLCKCLLDADSSEETVISPRKQKILSTVATTEEYLRVRRIPELIRFLLTKVISDASNRPIAFLETLLNDCMLFRVGHGLPPVLYEDRHLRAVIKSFDPGNRGWLSSGQVRRAFTTLGLTFKETLEERISCEVVFDLLKNTQEKELFDLLTAGICITDDSSSDDIGSNNGGSDSPDSILL